MTRSRSIILAAFILVLSAGVVLGRLWATLPIGEATSSTQPATQPSWLAEQLNLTPTQRQQVDAIWAQTKQVLSRAGERRHALENGREQAVLAMLSTDQQAKYQQIMADYRAQRTELDKEREVLIRNADEQSRTLLDDSQKRKWDLLRGEHAWRGPPHFAQPPSSPPSVPGVPPQASTTQP